MRWRTRNVALRPHHPARRASDHGSSESGGLRRRRTDQYLNLHNWGEQRAQFVTRYLFVSLGIAYFNMGELIARSAEWLVFINAVHAVYFVLTTLYLLHALRRPASMWRVRGAMWTDLVGVSCAVLADSNVISPAYLVFLVIILGNGMRYGLRAFAEAAAGSLLVTLTVVGIRFADSLQSMTMVGGFFLLFVAIIVLYSYALMSNIERARAGLEAASRNDSLTGLLNRRGLYEHSQPLFDALGTQHAPLAVLFADLDGFKAVNDRHGHDVGDRVLQRVAQAITKTIRMHDLAARFGGDEFVVIMPHTNLAQATVVAKRLQALIGEALVGDAAVSLTVGIGESPTHGANLDELLKQVDLAMYQGKQTAGKGGIQLAVAVAAG